MKSSKFNLGLFVFMALTFGALTFVTLIAAAAIDEGTGGTGLLTHMPGKLFYIFQFPTHTLFFEFMNGSMFFPGLLLNCFFYGLLIERIISIYKRKFYGN